MFGFSLSSNFVLTILFHRFLGTLKQHTVQGSIHGEDDLNVEHLQLLLLLFHNLSERGRRSVLTMATQAITDVAQGKDSQLKAVPLNLARLLLLFDYLIRHYSKAPLYLFEQVQAHIYIITLSSWYFHLKSFNSLILLNQKPISSTVCFSFSYTNYLLQIFTFEWYTVFWKVYFFTFNLLTFFSCHT